MKQFGNEGIVYSADYFDDDSLRELFQESEEPVMAAAAEPVARFFEVSNQEILQAIEDSPRAFGPVPKAEVGAAFSDAWDLMLQDPEFAAEARQRGYTKADGLADFRRSLEKPVTQDVDRENSRLLDVSYRKTVEDGAYVHRIGEEEILRIPQSVGGAALASDQADRAVLIAFIVVDVLSVVAAAAGVYVAYQKEVVAKSLRGVLGAFRKLFNTKTARMMKDLAQKKKYIDIAFKILGMLRGSTSLKDVVGRFVSSMARWEKWIAVTQLVAAVGLAIASFGASLAASIAALAATCVILATDIYSLCKSY